MSLGPVELLIILAIIFCLVVPIVVGIVFLTRNKGLDDSHGEAAYPPGWQPPPTSPPPPPSDAGAPPYEAGPPPGPPPT
ncbi:hypothetical protein ACE2AJ_03520 [Aquihabitans daechungensis]|uniref:hypothetical protein n=1 Tax=Aquihabitans daechungensis TaxID=1052257 RepID=UPI003BA23653